ncbi:MAG: methyltransferase domain-containing protein [Burkholderiaceae bacterium]
MTDPFQDVDSAGAEFIDLIVSGLEKRADDAQMSAMIDAYLMDLDWPHDARHLEIGAGSGAVSRRMGERAGSGSVTGLDPSPGLIRAAKSLAEGHANVDFQVAGGDELAYADASVDNVVMHTVLSHVANPAALIGEAARVLRPGGRLAVCDADYQKLSFSSFESDPLDACARYFAAHFVTQPYLIASLRQRVQQAGLTIEKFEMSNRVVTATDGNLVTVVMATNQMVDRSEISRSLADALVAEYQHRAAAGSLFAFTPFCTLVARKGAV